MKYLYIVIIACLFAVPVLADTTQSRDGDGQKIQGMSFGTVQSKLIGTGTGFVCFTTVSKMSWQVKIAATVPTNSATLPFMVALNSTANAAYPVTDKFEQWQNAPTSKSPTVLKVCLRGYSSVSKTAFMVSQ
jgi:hypothetical protein